jgi:hypothetical protein
MANAIKVAHLEAARRRSTKSRLWSALDSVVGPPQVEIVLFDRRDDPVHIARYQVAGMQSEPDIPTRHARVRDAPVCHLAKSHRRGLRHSRSTVRIGHGPHGGSSTHQMDICAHVVAAVGDRESIHDRMCTANHAEAC